MKSTIATFLLYSTNWLLLFGVMTTNIPPCLCCGIPATQTCHHCNRALCHSCGTGGIAPSRHAVLYPYYLASESRFCTDCTKSVFAPLRGVVGIGCPRCRTEFDQLRLAEVYFTKNSGGILHAVASYHSDDHSERNHGEND